MKHGTLEIFWAGESLTLLPERALWWKREKTMFIADPHFGKAAAFRFAGIAVPETSHDDDLERLEKIIQIYRATKLVILGDFFHAKIGRNKTTLAALKNWRDEHQSLEIVLIIGNHDRHAGLPPKNWTIQSVEEPWMLTPFICCHKPTKLLLDKFILAGHLHPAFESSERSGLKAREVCFYLQKNTMILPAFGNFTGTHTIQAILGEQVFLIVEDQILNVTQIIK